MRLTTQAIVALGYIGLLLLFSARPEWWDKTVAAAKRRAKELRGMLTL